MKWKVGLSLVVSEGAEENVNESLSYEKEIEVPHRLVLKLATGTTDFEVDLTTVIGTVTEAYIESNQYITVKRDLIANAEIQCKVFLLSGTSLQKLFISNNSGAEATIIIDVGGND